MTAGTDRVLMDAYCAALLNLKPEKIGMIRKAAQIKLGSADLKKAHIREVSI